MRRTKKAFKLLLVFIGVNMVTFGGLKKLLPYIAHIHNFVQEMGSQTILSPFVGETTYSMSLGNKSIIMVNAPNWMTPFLNKFDFDSCDVTACTFGYKQSLKYVNTSDAVILHGVGYSKHLLEKVKPGQVWIFAAWESPHHAYYINTFNKPSLHNQINWTMTYRLDSDIPTPYSIIIKNKEVIRMNYTQIVSSKKKLVAWVVSHYPTPSKREKYVNLLQKHLPVDIFGRCGPTGVKNSDKNLFRNIENTYKFYLSFENSLCRDYVTEKLFIWQNKSIVPIVRGSANYSYYYPKGSYIDVNDFKTVKDLAKHLHFLDKNDSEYVKYLKAKENYQSTNLEESIQRGFCDICKKLHTPVKYQNIYENVYTWYTNDACTTPNDIQ